MSDSHVAKTSEIKSFAITESEGIAKGVRRLVAITGADADESILVGQEWTKRTDALEKLQGKDAEAALKSFPIVSFLRHNYFLLMVVLQVVSFPELITGRWLFYVVSVQELAASNASYATKAQLSDRHAKIHKNFMDQNKARSAKESKEVSLIVVPFPPFLGLSPRFSRLTSRALLRPSNPLPRSSRKAQTQVVSPLRLPSPPTVSRYDSTFAAD